MVKLLIAAILLGIILGDAASNGVIASSAITFWHEIAGNLAAIGH